MKYPIKKPSKMYGRLIFIILIVSLMIQKADMVFTQPLSYYDYSPRLMEISNNNLYKLDRVLFVKGIAVDNDPSLVFYSTFTVTLQRIQNLAPVPYLVTIGFKTLQVDIPPYPSAVNVYIVLTSQASTSFDLLAYCSSQIYFTRYQISYVAISKKIENVYFYNQIYTVNQAPTWPTFFDYNFTDSSVQSSGAPYTAMVSIYHFSVTQNSGIAPQMLLVYCFQANPLDPTIYTIRLHSHGLHVYSFGVQGFIISNSLINNVKLKNILLFYHYGYTLSASTSTPIYGYPGVSLTPNNTFFGLYYFNSNNNKISYILSSTYTQFAEISLTKADSNPSYMGVFILAALRNHCPDPYTYDETEQICKMCMPNCDTCDGPQCSQCALNFTLSTDKLSCECSDQLVSGICYDFDSSNMKGCLSAQVSSNIITCLMCSISQNLILSNNECICKSGYEFDSNRKCIETCGDGRLFYLACDDGNLINGDGCSDKCTVEMGFVCTLQGSSKCRYDMTVEYGLMSIMKNKNNSAIMKLKPRRNLRFPVSYDDLVDSTGNQRLNMTIRINETDVLLSPTLMSVQDNEITLLIEYDMTIECQVTTVDIDLTETIYTSEKSQVKFDACGDNEPLVISQYSEMFLKTEYVYIGVGMIVLLLLGVGLCTPKYIGVEAILTLQLIYYSCLLVTDVDKYPVGFKTYVTFKYSTGFNDFFNYTDLLLNHNFTKKVYWLTLQKTSVENYNLSFIVLVLASAGMFLTLMYQSKTESNYEERSSSHSSKETQSLQQSFKLALKISQAAYNLMSHIVVWSILQILSALFLQVLISNKDVQVVSTGMFLHFRGLIGVVSTFLITLIGINNLKNILLSQYTWGEISKKPEELKYRQLNFLYLILMGVMIFIFNQQLIFSFIPVSVFVLFIHIVYMVMLRIIDPYQQSLNIHKYGLFLCQCVYLVFLIVINFINFVGIENEVISLVIVYTILVFCGIIIIFTVIRLYYEYRYGADLEKKIQKERQLQKQLQLQKDENELKRKMKSFESKFKQNLNQYQLSRLQNKFLIENQLQEELMNQEITFLNDRPNLSDQKKEVYYFQKFHKKPLNWLKTNDVEEYQKRINEMEAKKAEQNEKKRRKMQSTEYKDLTKKLRKQFLHMNFSGKKNQKQDQIL